MGTATFVDIIVAILLPPLGVFLKFGCEVIKSIIVIVSFFYTVEFWICLVLTLFGYIPGIIYAVYAITK
ncbi:hypothetical protein BUALT_Bualt15G0106200 [Buddleja alternifolia]|uniref:Uncharacterized protein n=1 Tax=Buddleja alternifolia TaxID=168488 RepID=A0AAV6WE63_9LAMI|nr:hypothetical protein BUALT_Bualt15G0106200 [Buddleja alternifolia]